MDEKIFKARTKKLAVSIINEVNQLPRSLATDAIARQIVRSGTSIGANYRAACRAKSVADMINKLKIVEEESDETLYWLELLVEAGLTQQERGNQRNPRHDCIFHQDAAESPPSIQNRKFKIVNQKIVNQKS